jgi:hypothetical protein
MHSTHDARAFVFSRFVIARHGAAGYDVRRTITLTGTMAEIDASNLHRGMVLDAHEAIIDLEACHSGSDGSLRLDDEPIDAWGSICS